MANYRINVVPAAERDLKGLRKGLSKRDKSALIEAIDQLATTPRPVGVEKLTGGDSLYRVKVGNFRIVYQIRDNELVICIAKVADRKEVYRGLLSEVRKRLKSADIQPRA